MKNDKMLIYWKLFHWLFSFLFQNLIKKKWFRLVDFLSNENRSLIFVCSARSLLFSSHPSRMSFLFPHCVDPRQGRMYIQIVLLLLSPSKNPWMKSYKISIWNSSLVCLSSQSNTMVLYRSDCFGLNRWNLTKTTVMSARICHWHRRCRLRIDYWWEMFRQKFM